MGRSKVEGEGVLTGLWWLWDGRVGGGVVVVVVFFLAVGYYQGHVGRENNIIRRFSTTICLSPHHACPLCFVMNVCLWK